MGMKATRRWRTALLAGALAGSAPALAADYQHPTALELARLPAYCPDTIGFMHNRGVEPDPAKIARWVGVMGELYKGMHHYCWGLIAAMREMSGLNMAERDRRFLLETSINEYDFVISRATDDFPVLPEILTWRARSLLRLGRVGEAIANIERATTLKPDYWQAYAYLSDYWRDKGDTAKAREVLQRGLANAPEATGLQSRMAKLERAEAKPAAKPATKAADPAAKAAVKSAEPLEKPSARSTADRAVKPSAEPAAKSPGKL